MSLQQQVSVPVVVPVRSSSPRSTAWSCECASAPTASGECYTRWRCCTNSSMDTCDEKYAWGDKPECKDYCDKKSMALQQQVSVPAMVPARPVSPSRTAWSCECASVPTDSGVCYTRWRCCTNSSMDTCDETNAWGDKPECKDY